MASDKEFILPQGQPSLDTVADVLEYAQVPQEAIDRGFSAWKGLELCHPTHEVVRRLAHLNFLIKEGVYTYDVAVELIATQPMFLEMKFGIVYEDEDLFVMNKPHDTRMDIPKHGERKWSGEFTCADWLEQIAPEAFLDKKRFAHNLDSATSGILCLSKSREAAARCNELWSGRKVEKEYLALVFGHVEWDEKYIDAPIEEDPSSDFRMQVGTTSLKSKPAQTQVEVLERGFLAFQGPHFKKPVTKCLLKPITGRRHQLRVHMKHLGHAIVGDAAYAEDWYTYRLFLHAFALHLPFSESKDLRLITADPFINAIIPG